MCAREAGGGAGAADPTPESAWFFNETSGTRYDAFGNRHLTDHDGVPYATGVVGNCAHTQSQTADEFFTAAGLDPGDVDFQFTLWVKLKDLQQHYILRENNTGASTVRFSLEFAASNDDFRWYVNGSAYVSSSSVLSAQMDTWYFLTVYHDAANDEIGLSVDNGPIVTGNYAGGCPTGGTHAFLISSVRGVSGGGNFHIDALHYWPRRLTPDEVTAMYNSGNGKEW